jgi:hypothetical protein
MVYKVLSGTFSPDNLEQAINNLAAEGWRVVSAFQAISWWRSRCPWTIVLERTRA